MISKLIVHGKDRQEALALLQRALGQYQVVGPSTNIEFLKRVAGHEGFKEGGVETNFIPVSSFFCTCPCGESERLGRGHLPSVTERWKRALSIVWLQLVLAYG